MRMTLDFMKKQILEAGLAYVQQGVVKEIPLADLIVKNTGFECVLVNTYCANQIQEFQMINYRDKKREILDFKLCVAVDFKYVEGKCVKIDVEFGI